jgi:DNA-binding transcriptional LysR family regulator
VGRAVGGRRRRRRGVDVELRHLTYAVAVADHLSFTRAAARLHLDQPSLSRQIRALERCVGVQLFHRTTRSVTITAAGAEFVLSARRILGEVDRAVECARHAGSRTGQLTVRLGDVPFGCRLMTTLVRELEASVPGLGLTLVAYTFATPDVGLGAGDVDAGLVLLPLSTPGLQLEPVLREARALLVAADHPWAARDSVTLAELEAEDRLLWAVPPEGEPVWRAHWAAGDRRGGRLPRRARFHWDLDEYAQLVATGRAFGLAMATVMRPLLSYGVAVVPVTDLTEPAVLAPAWRKSQLRSPSRMGR